MAENWAILIGINQYNFLPNKKQLKYAVRDAEQFQSLLCKQLGFDSDKVLLCTDTSEAVGEIITRPLRNCLIDVLTTTAFHARNANNLLFFFSGHGILGNDKHDYLITSDGKTKNLEMTAISVDFIVRCLLECQAGNTILIFDMCRDEAPDGRKGISEVGTQTSQLVSQKGITTIFSCSRGQESYEIPELQQGSFTYALLEGLSQNLRLRDLEQYLVERVAQVNKEHGKPMQTPLVIPEPGYKFDFPLLLASADHPFNLSTQVLSEELLALSPRSQVIEELNTYTEHSGVTALEMVLIPGGTFTMGSDGSRIHLNESPAHEVRIQPFWISKHTITVAQWNTLVISPPVHRQLKKHLNVSKDDADHPIVQISWLEAVEFCDRLSRLTRYNFRLPTEAEWEYACRARANTIFNFGNNISIGLANYNAKSTQNSFKRVRRTKTSRVGSYAPNLFGLHDMHGNVWEWCLDHLHENYINAPNNGTAWITNGNPNYRIIRGGSWKSEPGECSITYRSWAEPIGRGEDIGFRIVMDLHT